MNEEITSVPPEIAEAPIKKQLTFDMIVDPETLVELIDDSDALKFVIDNTGVVHMTYQIPHSILRMRHGTPVLEGTVRLSRGEIIADVRDYNEGIVEQYGDSIEDLNAQIVKFIKEYIADVPRDEDWERR
jgi:hypothetical protein